MIRSTWIKSGISGAPSGRAFGGIGTGGCVASLLTPGYYSNLPSGEKQRISIYKLIGGCGASLLTTGYCSGFPSGGSEGHQKDGVLRSWPSEYYSGLLSPGYCSDLPSGENANDTLAISLALPSGGSANDFRMCGVELPATLVLLKLKSCHLLTIPIANPHDNAEHLPAIPRNRTAKTPWLRRNCNALPLTPDVPLIGKKD